MGIINPNTKIKNTITNDKKIEFTPSKYQQDILDAVVNDNCNILVDAKAGSGKTSTLKLIQQTLENRGEKCTILAFNKHIVAELEKKIPNANMCNIATIPSMGLKFLIKYIYSQKCQWYLRDGKLDKTKPFLNRKNVVNRTKQICDELYTEMIKSAVDELYSSSLNKSELEDLHKCIISDLANLCDSVRMHYDIQWDESLNKINITDNAIKHRLLLDKYNDLGDYILNNDVLRDKFNIAELVRNTLQKRIDEFLALEGVNYNGITYIGIEYIDMVFFPVLFENRMSIPNNVIPFTKYIMCDECQDMNRAQQKLLKRLNTGNTRYIFVGDNKQAIYAFAGADTQSVQNLTKEYDLKQLPLNICYRCPENVVKLAKIIVPELEWNADREDKGEVSIITQTELYGNIVNNDLVICRKNSDVMGVYTKLAFDMKKNVCLVNADLVNKLSNEIKSCINQYLKFYKLGFNIQVKLKDKLDEYQKSLTTPLTSAQYKDIQTQFIDELIKENLANKSKDNITIPTLDYLKLCMQDYRVNGSYSIEENNMLTMYYDKILYLINKYENEHFRKSKITLEEFESELPSLFKYKKENNNVIVISSVHQMKGGEADNVYIYDYPAFPYQFKSLSEEQLLQESNLQYVALTRAKKTLSLVLLDDDKYRKANELNAECVALVNNVLKH